MKIIFYSSLPSARSRRSSLPREQRNLMGSCCCLVEGFLQSGQGRHGSEPVSPRWWGIGRSYRLNLPFLSMLGAHRHSQGPLREPSCSVACRKLPNWLWSRRISPVGWARTH